LAGLFLQPQLVVELQLVMPLPQAEMELVVVLVVVGLDMMAVLSPPMVALELRVREMLVVRELFRLTSWAAVAVAQALLVAML
jgi:hypothetical protein